jgi:hypothetical protein
VSFGTKPQEARFAADVATWAFLIQFVRIESMLITSFLYRASRLRNYPLGLM